MVNEKRKQYYRERYAKQRDLTRHLYAELHARNIVELVEGAEGNSKADKSAAVAKYLLRNCRSFNNLNDGQSDCATPVFGV